MQKLEITRRDLSVDELKRCYRDEKNVRIKERILAIIHVMEGKNCTEVGAILKRDRNTIQLWVKSYNREGFKGLKPIQSPGKPSSLTKEQLNELKADIQKNPRELGYEFSNWTGKTAAMHVKNKFGVQLKVRRIISLLHALGVTLQRPRHKLIKADPKAQATFQETLKKKSKIWVQPMSCSSRTNAV